MLECDLRFFLFGMAQPYDNNYQFDYQSEPERLSPGVWSKHVILLLATFCTTTIAGVVPPFAPGVNFPAGNLPIFENPLAYISWVPTLYSMYIVNVIYHMFTEPLFLQKGLEFSVPLLFILFSHEMGH